MSTPQTEMVAKYDPGGQPSLSKYVEAAQRSLVLEALDPRPGQVVVEVGAGTGKLPHYLADGAGVRVLAVETSRSLSDLGKRRMEGLPVDWLTGSPEQIPLDGGTADAVLLVDVLEFVQDPGEVLAEAR